MAEYKTLRRVGGSVYVALPPEMIRRLGFKAGDHVMYLVRGKQIIIRKIKRRK